MPEIMIDPTADLMDMQPNPGGQADFAADWTNTNVAAAGGWMSGKTFIGASKLVTLHIHNAFDDQGRATYVPSAVMAPTYSGVLAYDVPAIQTACEYANLRCVFKSKRQVLEFPDLGTRKNPSEILLKSAERPDRIAGWQVGAGWGDEATRWPQNWLEPHKDAYLQFQSRVRHPDARLIQLIYTFTHEGDATRLYEEFNSGKAGHALYTIKTSENPLALEYEKRQRDSLTPELAKQYLDGEAVDLKGKRAYATFTKERNENSTLCLRKHLPLHLMVDFNINPGMHLEIGQYDEANDMFTVVHEIHAPRMDLRQSIQAFRVMIEDKLGGWQWPELHIFGDASGESKWAGTGESCWQILQQGMQDMGIKYRVRVPRANPPQIDRINAMNVAMMDLRGKVHWQCHPRCVRLINDMKKVKTNERGSLDKQALDLSHASDAEGYRVNYLRPARVKSQATAAGRIGFGS